MNKLLNLLTLANNTGIGEIDEFSSVADLKDYLSPSNLNSLLRTNIYTHVLCNTLFDYILDNKHLWHSTQELTELDYYLV